MGNYINMSIRKTMKENTVILIHFDCPLKAASITQI